jgi:hypothetical protein
MAVVYRRLTRLVRDTKTTLPREGTLKGKEYIGVGIYADRTDWRPACISNIDLEGDYYAIYSSYQYRCTVSAFRYDYPCVRAARPAERKTGQA